MLLVTGLAPSVPWVASLHWPLSWVTGSRDENANSAGLLPRIDCWLCNFPAENNSQVLLPCKFFRAILSCFPKLKAQGEVSADVLCSNIHLPGTAKLSAPNCCPEKLLPLRTSCRDSYSVIRSFQLPSLLIIKKKQKSEAGEDVKLNKSQWVLDSHYFFIFKLKSIGLTMVSRVT